MHCLFLYVCFLFVCVNVCVACTVPHHGGIGIGGFDVYRLWFSFFGMYLVSKADKK